MPRNVSPGFTPGLLLVQAQRLEDLAELVIPWMGLYPPGPLEDDLVVVPSNGMGEWFKARAALRLGVCAGMRVELPARFSWRLMRDLLGSSAIAPPGSGLFDKPALAWWLAARRAASLGRQVLQLEDARWAQDVADLFDQYQVYRADWLSDWAEGRDVLRREAGAQDFLELPGEHRWQAELWRALIQELQADQQAAGDRLLPSAAPGDGQTFLHAPRTELHRLAHERLHACTSSIQASLLPGRVVVFGCSHLPPPLMELLAALSRHRRVVLAVPNPCDVQWVDISRANGQSSGQPLLAAWGRQVQDFILQVEKIDDRLSALEGRAMVRSEAGQEHSPDTALGLLQSAIQRNEPVHETRQRALSRGIDLNDPSIRFHVCHTALREVEVLHDHLLSIFDASHAGHTTPPSLQPHQVVVMVPDLSVYVPAIRAVFGQHDITDPRRIPWALSDQPPDAGVGLQPVLDWLLSLPARRATFTELHHLLQCPLLRSRWRLSDSEVVQLETWAEQAGVRWGLNAGHRAGLGVAEAGATHTWRFGVDRMLAGYAWSPNSTFAPMDPSASFAPLAAVSGLAAEAAGRLSAIISRIERWLEHLSQPRTASQWCVHIRELVGDLLEASDVGQAALAALEGALTSWVRTSHAANGLEMPWAVMHQAVMSLYEEPSPRARFQSGAVTFCTLMPLRTVPFEVVCLLGMNDGDYPRPSPRTSTDLMSLPGMARPGDRSRRADDRQLMLEALLSARRHFLVSWIGRRVTDNLEQPPSVLIGQLRDTLRSVWSDQALDRITLEHPLQPFSARYFTPGNGLTTYARQWEWTHSPAVAPTVEPPAFEPPPRATWPHRVERWLLHPTAAILEERMGVAWPRDPDDPLEDETFRLGGLDGWQVHRRFVRHLQSTNGQGLEDLLQRLGLEGRLPLGAPGRRVSREFQLAWQAWAQRIQQAVGGASPWSMQSRCLVLPPIEPFQWAGLGTGPVEEGAAHDGLLQWEIPGFLVGQGVAESSPGRLIDIPASPLFHKPRRRGEKPRIRDHVLVLPWWRQMVAAAAGSACELKVVARDGSIQADAPDTPLAQAAVSAVLTAWWSNLQQGHPWPADSRAIEEPWATSPSRQAAALNRLALEQRAWGRVWGSSSDWSAQSREQWQVATERVYGAYRAWRQEKLELIPA